MAKYSYKHPYEYHWERVIRVYEYPKDFHRKFDDPTPFVFFTKLTANGVIRERIPITKMRLLEE